MQPVADFVIKVAIHKKRLGLYCATLRTKSCYYHVVTKISKANTFLERVGFYSERDYHSFILKAKYLLISTASVSALVNTSSRRGPWLSMAVSHAMPLSSDAVSTAFM